MSSIRLFVLGSLSERGPMHGHQLRLLAEEEHVSMWTDISVGAVYGAMKRLAAEDLIRCVRVEREGNYPERQVFDVTPAGLASLAELRLTGLSRIVLKPDPFDLALTRLDPDRLDELPALLAERTEQLRAHLIESDLMTARALPSLTRAERTIMGHRAHRIRAEIAWHDDLLADLPNIIADERFRTDAHV